MNTKESKPDSLKKNGWLLSQQNETERSVGETQTPTQEENHRRQELLFEVFRLGTQLKKARVEKSALLELNRLLISKLNALDKDRKRQLQSPQKTPIKTL